MRLPPRNERKDSDLIAFAKRIVSFYLPGVDKHHTGFILVNLEFFQYLVHGNSLREIPLFFTKSPLAEPRV